MAQLKSKQDEIEIRPITHNRCYAFIEPDPLPESQGSIIIPEAHQEQREHRFWWGTVRSVAPGHWEVDDETGTAASFIATDLKVGDRVYYDRNCGASGDPLGEYGLAIIPEGAILFKAEEEEEDE